VIESSIQSDHVYYRYST